MKDLNPLFALAMDSAAMVEDGSPAPEEPRGKKGRMYDTDKNEEEESPTKNWREPLFRTHSARVHAIRANRR